MTAPEWNVIVTTYDREYGTSMRLLAPFGRLAPTEYFNLFVMHVDDVLAFLDAIEEQLITDKSIANSVARISPVTTRFDFSLPEEFEERACLALEQWLDLLRDRSFHVRVHRRGFKGRLSSQREERLLGRHLLSGLEHEGSGATVDFDDPDLTIVVETLDDSAGAAIWTREQQQRYELLRFD